MGTYQPVNVEWMENQSLLHSFFVSVSNEPNVYARHIHLATAARVKCCEAFYRNHPGEAVWAYFTDKIARTGQRAVYGYKKLFKKGGKTHE